MTAAQTGDGIVTVLLNPGTPEDGCTWVYKLGTAVQEVTYGTALSGWTELAASGTEVSVGTDTVITVAEIDADGNPKAVGSAKVA